MAYKNFNYHGNKSNAINCNTKIYILKCDIIFVYNLCDFFVGYVEIVFHKSFCE